MPVRFKHCICFCLLKEQSVFILVVSRPFVDFFVGDVYVKNDHLASFCDVINLALLLCCHYL